MPSAPSFFTHYLPLHSAMLNWQTQTLEYTLLDETCVSWVVVDHPRVNHIPTEGKGWKKNVPTWRRKNFNKGTGQELRSICDGTILQEGLSFIQVFRFFKFIELSDYSKPFLRFFFLLFLIGIYKHLTKSITHIFPFGLVHGRKPSYNQGKYALGITLHSNGT